MSKKYFSEDNTYNRVHLSNHIALSLLFVAIPWGFIFALMHRYMLSLIAIPIVIILIGCWLLNKKGHYTFSNLGLILCTATSVFFYASVLGKESGIQWVYFGLTAVSLVLFEPKQKSSLLFGLFFPLVCFYLLELTHYSLFQKEQLDPSSLYFVFTTITTMTFFLIVGCIYFYYFANQRSTQNLVIAHTHLQASHAELNATYTKLQISQKIQLKLIKEKENIRLKAAELAGVQKTIASLNHELNSPLCAVLMGAQSLEKESLDHPLKKTVGAIYQASQKMNKVLKKISKLTNTKTINYFGKVDMLDLS